MIKKTDAVVLDVTSKRERAVFGEDCTSTEVIRRLYDGKLLALTMNAGL